MPYDYRISAKNKMILVDASGPFSAGDIIVVIGKVLADQAHHSDYAAIVDIRKVTFIPQARELKQISDHVVRMKDSLRGRVAVVVPGGFFHGMAKMTTYYNSRKGLTVEVFRDMDRAKHWINTGEDPEP